MLTHHVRVQTKMYQQPATCNIPWTLNLRWWIVMLFPRGIEVWSDYFKHITAVKELKTRLCFLTHTSLVSYLITKCCEHCHTTSSPRTHPSFTEVCFFLFKSRKFMYIKTSVTCCILHVVKCNMTLTAAGLSVSVYHAWIHYAAWQCRIVYLAFSPSPSLSWQRVQTWERWLQFI